MYKQTITSSKIDDESAELLSKQRQQSFKSNRIQIQTEESLIINNHINQSNSQQNIFKNEKMDKISPIILEENLSIRSDELDDTISYFDNILKQICVTGIQNLNLIYNYSTIILKEDIDSQTNKMLDIITIRRKEREKEKSIPIVSQIRARKLTPSKQKKKFKFYMSKLIIDDNGPPKIFCTIFDTKQIVHIKTLNPIDFEGIAPSQSIAQVNILDPITGRFFVYNNLGKIFVYSSEILSTQADRPLITMSLNENPPRQDPILYLFNDQDDGQKKCILMVVGGYFKVKRQGIRPLRTIKVFQILKREVSLSPIITITMLYPRMAPIVFQITKNKGLLWQDSQIDQQGLNKVIIILGGNSLSEQVLQDNIEISDGIINANSTCEYIEIKQITDYISRAQIIIEQDEITDDIKGMNYSRFQINVSFNVKYQNDFQLTSKIKEYLHHGCVVKRRDEVFQDRESLYIIGGGSPEIFQIVAISPKFNEFNLVKSSLYTEKQSLIYSQTNTITYQGEIYFTDDSKETIFHKLGIRSSKVKMIQQMDRKCFIM